MVEYLYLVITSNSEIIMRNRSQIFAFFCVKDLVIVRYRNEFSCCYEILLLTLWLVFKYEIKKKSKWGEYFFLFSIVFANIQQKTTNTMACVNVSQCSSLLTSLIRKSHTGELMKKDAFTCESACFLDMILFVRLCQSCSGRFRMVSSSRESWAGGGRASASSPPLLPHTSFSPWPNSPPAWRGTNTPTTLTDTELSLPELWASVEANRVSLEGMQFHCMPLNWV